METELSTEQVDSVLKLCDMLGIEDFELATQILKENQWNFEKALGFEEKSEEKTEEIQNEHANNNPFISYDSYDAYDDENENEYENEYEYYEQELKKNEDLENKKRIFNLGFETMPLLKTKSQVGNTLEDKLVAQKEISQECKTHFLDYQESLLNSSKTLCERILKSKSPQIRKQYENNVKKSENNRKFISSLHKKYSTHINFTFGTFLLNLTRSFLSKKLLLVYVHKSEFEDNNSIRMLLTHREISNFIVLVFLIENKNFVTYGMFDNSDDYDILQKYAPMKTLPCFLLFRLNKSLMKEELVSQYTVLNSGSDNFIEWLATNSGIVIKKKNGEKSGAQVNSTSGEQSHVKNAEMSNIILQQNLEYEEMEKLYKLKREKSSMAKKSVQEFNESVENLKQKFVDEPVSEPGQTLQIKFRLPEGSSLLRNFRSENKIEDLFDYVHCFGRTEFENEMADFDLTQSFPKLSLMDKKQQTIKEIFGESERENIIVKEL